MMEEYIMSINTKQVYFWGLKTSDFYTVDEKEIRDNFSLLEFYELNVKSYLEKVEYYTGIGNLDKAEEYREKIAALQNAKDELLDGKVVDDLKQEAKSYSKKLRDMVKANNSKRQYNGNLEYARRIGQFTSSFTRALSVDEELFSNFDVPFTDNILIIEVGKDVDNHLQEHIMTQLINDNLEFNDKTYIYAFSSAGQIRTKRLLFVEEKAYEKVQDKLYAGMTDEKINAKGGAIAGKILAYKALCNSSSMPWDEYIKDKTKKFDINRCIVIPDMEHTIRNVDVRKISMDYKMGEGKEFDDLLNPVTDGIGFVHPDFHNKNFQFRAPFMKGLLSPFDWVEFAKDYGIDLDTFTIVDAWGDKQSLKDVDIIFTQSQFKMAKFFDSWQEYKDSFIENECEFVVCDDESLNVEDFKDVTVSYQMLQTLHTLKDGELEGITAYTKKRIVELIESANQWKTTDKDGDIVIDEEKKQLLLEVLGVDGESYNRPFIEALTLTDDMLHDNYVKESIRKRKESMLDNAKKGKLLMEGGRSAYVLPDVVAVGQWLFNLEITGALEPNELSCKLIDDNTKVDALRSPHLYLEHFIANNVTDKVYDDNRKLNINKWYVTNGIYVSINSTSSFQLAYDVDGDKLLVIPSKGSSKTFVEAAERHMKDILPLSYEMPKGKPVKINNKVIAKTLKKSFKANIGTISNLITKILNKGEVTEDDIKLVAKLKMKNNFLIDYAKTNFDPKITDETLKQQLDEIKKILYPYFFKYVKKSAYKKNKNKFASINNSTMNQIANSFNGALPRMQFATGEFDYSLYMYDKDIERIDEIVNTYEEFVNDKSNTMALFNEVTDHIEDDNVTFYLKSNKIQEFKDKLLAVNSNVQVIVDVLIKYLYQKHYIQVEVDGKVKNKRIYKNKNLHMLWEAFGDVIVDNMKKNLGITKTAKRCGCGELFEAKSNRQQYCPSCAEKNKRKKDAERQAKRRAKNSKIA